MKKVELLLVVGARPQIIKSAALMRPWRQGRWQDLHLSLLHTGQHYDHGMSGGFFEELDIPRPDVDLEVGSAGHGEQTARMIEGIERRLVSRRPDAVVVFGDTNSTLAAALAAVKLHVPVAHVEAGLRSHDKRMPEEINRLLTDHCSTWLFCPTMAAVRELRREGMNAPVNGAVDAGQAAVILSGDVMFDNSLYFGELAAQRSAILTELGLSPGGYMLATVHRDHNTDDPKRLSTIIHALVDAGDRHGLPVVMPLHPRTRKQLSLVPDELVKRAISSPMLRLIDPVGFLDMVQLERSCRLVITDSGGVQKEAYFYRKPCVVLRPTTEWVELVDHGQARLADADPVRIAEAVRWGMQGGLPVAEDLYGDGSAGVHILIRLFQDLR
ncbi:MAG: UDP-N-acetylglucosamine 2-epimerase (non-hydrolyzing) [Flavobacteriales bacterium]|nr:UDP-N-acetylglucosamine 2-epimerase (non-hydrolyzing) [Flavobacteriales bacterium]